LKRFIILFFITTSISAINIDFDTAVKLYEEKDYNNSYSIFFQLFNKEPSPKIAFYLGNISYFQGRLEEAWYWYEKGIKTSSILNENLVFNAGLTLIKLKKYKEAIKIFEYFDNKTPLVYFLMSLLYYNIGDYRNSSKSIEALIKTSRVLPDSFLLIVYKNYFYSALKENDYQKVIKTSFFLERFDKSEIFYINNAFFNFLNDQNNKAMKIIEGLDNDKAFVIMALIYIKNQDFSKAIYYLDKVKKFTEDIAKIKAYCFYRVGENEKALGILSDVSLKSPYDYILRAMILYELNRYEEAKKSLELRFFKDIDKDTLFNLLSIYVKIGEYDKGFFVVNRFIEDINFYDLKIYAFNLLLVQGKYEEAFDYAINILKEEKESRYDYIFLYNLGKLYEKKNNIEEAKSLYKRSIKIKPDFVYPYASLAGIYTVKKDYDNAIDCYTVVIRLLPENPYYYYLLAQVYALSGDDFSAKKYARLSIERGLNKTIIDNDPLFYKISLE